MTHLTWLIDQIYQGQGFPCLFHMLTGLYCPGCGGTRAIRLLLRGEVAKSFVYHPFVPYLALVLGIEALLFAAELVRGQVQKRRVSLSMRSFLWGLERRLQTWTLTGAGIVVVNWVVKNVLLLQGIDLLPPLG
ncbi:MAG: DUF2752 domain-containing protein [Lachnospiraceae bacterium]|nr:DUF2752 domain-containing protein [Lachnospiraceae bacterium]